MRALRFFAYSLATLFLAFAITLFLAPTFLSSQTFRDKAFPWFSKLTGAEIRVDRLQLSWFHDQEIKGLSLITAGTNFSLESLRLTSPLWKVFVPGKDLGSLQIKKPHLDYSLENLLLPSNEEEAPSILLSLFIHPLVLDLDEGYIHLITPQSAVTLENINCAATFVDLEKPLMIHFEAQSNSQQKTGSIAFKLNIDKPLEWLSSLDADVKIQDFPLEIAAPFVDSTLTPLLSSWSREPLDLTLQFKRKDELNECHFLLNSAPLKTQMKLGIDQEFVYLKEPAPLTLCLKKDEVNPFLKSPELIQVHTDILIQSTLDSFKAPLATPTQCLWNLEAQTNNLILERRGHKTTLNALNVTAKAEAEKYSAQALSTQSNQLQALLEIGSGLREKDLQKFDATFSGITPNDVFLFADLPTQKLSWLFPLEVHTSLQRKDENLLGNITARSNQFQSSAELSINDKNIYLTKGKTHLNGFILDTLKLGSTDLRLDYLTLPRNLSLPDCTAKVSLTSSELAIENRLLKNIKLKTTLEHSQFDTRFDSSLIQAQTTLEVTPGQIKCSKPFKLSAHLKPEEAKIWIQDIGFVEPVDLDLDVHTASFNSTNPLEDQWLEASVKLKPILIQKTVESPVIGIPATELQVRCNFNASSAHAMFYSVPSTDKNLVPASFKGQAQIRNKSLTKAQIQISDLSSDWVDILAEAKGKLATLLGHSIAADVNIELTSKNPLIHLSAKTPHLKADFSWKQDGKWTLAKAAELHFQVPTKACAKILEGIVPQNSIFELVQGLDFITRIDRLETLDKEFALNKLYASGQIFVKKAAIRHISQDRRSELQELKVNWKFDGPASFFEQQLNAKVLTSKKYDGNTLSGKLESKSRHDTLFDSAQKISFAKAKHTLDLKADQLSSDWIDFAASFGQAKNLPPLSELLGPIFQIQSHLELEKKTGPIDFTFSSTFSQLKMKGKLLEEFFTLRSPIEFELQPHPGLSRYFTSQSNTSSISSISTNEAIRVYISDKNFVFPISNFDVKKIRIDHLHATIGEIEWKNRGVLHFFVNLLKWQQRGDSQTLTIESLPIDLSMKDGIIRLERTDALVAELFPVATWGNIDLGSQKLDLTVGISKAALENALAIADLPEGYLMLVPVHGPLSNPAAEATLATTKIAALIARNSKNIVNQIAPINITGQLIGGILGIIMPLPDEKAVVPAPRYPIPWKFARKESNKS